MGARRERGLPYHPHRKAAGSPPLPERLPMNSSRYVFAAILLGLAAACTATPPTLPRTDSTPVQSSGLIGSGFGGDSLSPPRDTLPNP